MNNSKVKKLNDSNLQNSEKVLYNQSGDNSIYNGYITLSFVIVLGLISTFVVTSLLYLNANAFKLVEVESEYMLAMYGAESCAEITMNNLQGNLAYPAGDVIVIDDTTCNIVAILGTGNNNRTVQVIAVNGDATARLEVGISEVQPNVVISSWERVASF